MNTSTVLSVAAITISVIALVVVPASIYRAGKRRGREEAKAAAQRLHLGALPSDAHPGWRVIAGEALLEGEYKALRARDDLVTVRATWAVEYPNIDIERYFDTEMEWLRQHPTVTLHRIVARDKLPSEQVALLASRAQNAPPNLHLYWGDTGDYELYVCEYVPAAQIRKAAAVLVLTSSMSRAPEYGVLLDGYVDSDLAAAAYSLKYWFDSINRVPWDQPKPQAAAPVRRKNLWSAAARIYDNLVSRESTDPFLARFIEREDEILGRLVAGFDGAVSFVEFGSGTGRTIDGLLAAERGRSKLVCAVGLDSSDRMIERARLKRAEREEGTAPGRCVGTYYFLADGNEAFQYLWRGRAVIAPELGDTPYLTTRPFDVAAYEASTRVFACLLNTLGVIDPGRREDFLRSMFTAADTGDVVALSVFSAKAFPWKARQLYDAIKELVGAKGGISEECFDDSKKEFIANGYYSHWFDEDEVVDLVRRCGGQMRGPAEIIETADGDELGRVFVCQK